MKRTLWVGNRAAPAMASTAFHVVGCAHLREKDGNKQEQGGRKLTVVDVEEKHGLVALADGEGETNTNTTKRRRMQTIHAMVERETNDHDTHPNQKEIRREKKKNK